MKLAEAKRHARPSHPPRRLKSLNSTLGNPMDTAALAMLVETEGHLRYYKSHPERNYLIPRWEPVLRIHMVDELLVRWASKVMGGTHVSFDKSVGAWYTEARGPRVIEVLDCIRPLVRGEKVGMVNCILRHGKYVISRRRTCNYYESRFISTKRIRKLMKRGLLR